MAYSRQGYADRSWELPEEWNGVRQVVVQDITLQGLASNRTTIPVVEGRLRLPAESGSGRFDLPGPSRAVKSQLALTSLREPIRVLRGPTTSDP